MSNPMDLRNQTSDAFPPDSPSASEVSDPVHAPTDGMGMPAGGGLADHPSPQTRLRAGASGRRLLKIGVVLLIVALVLAFSVLPRLRQHARLAAAARAERASVPKVTTTRPHKSSDRTLTLPASIGAIRETTIYARGTGYLRSRLVDIGDRVKAGQLLAVIESPEVEQQLEQARAEAARSRAGAVQGEAEIVRLRALVEHARSAIQVAQAGVDRAIAGRLAARARVAQARHVLQEHLGQETHARVQRDLADRTCRRYRQLASGGFVTSQELDEKEQALASARAGLDTEGSGVLAAQADLRTAQALVVSGDADVRAAQGALEAAHQDVQAATAAVASGQAGSEAARAGSEASNAGVRRFAAMNAYSRVVAPFAGVITARNVDEGALVKADNLTSGAGASGTGSQQGIFGIARVDVMRVLVAVPQTWIASMRKGAPASLLVQEYPARQFPAHIFRLAGGLDPTSRTLQVEVHIPNPDQVLLPGMYAQVRFSGVRGQGGLLIPATTLRTTAEGTTVAVVTTEGKVHFLPVKVARDLGNELEIATGLSGDEHLVINPGDDLTEDARVRVEEAPPSSQGAH